jgi:hypothetical protein
MYHTIEFLRGFTADVQRSPQQRLERIRIRRGTQLQAQLMPYVIHTSKGPIEVADLFLQDGAALREVHFAWFCLL